MQDFSINSSVPPVFVVLTGKIFDSRWMSYFCFHLVVGPTVIGVVNQSFDQSKAFPKHLHCSKKDILRSQGFPIGFLSVRSHSETTIVNGLLFGTWGSAVARDPNTGVLKYI